jgi:hypothetical protein
MPFQKGLTETISASNWICFLIFTIFLITISPISAQTDRGQVMVDKNGVMRWDKSGEEVQGFGVNYTVPFAHAYKTGKRQSIDLKKVIDNDVYHFSRLGFDLYRVHVWDTEISDTLGNLIPNENLDLFDYLLKRLQDHDIKAVVTPIAFWGGGWPEPDEYTPGFSHRYGKGKCLTNPDAIKAQENYLTQFMNHVNPYTGKAYKDDPNIIAVEVSNEPHHRESPEIVTAFVKRMVAAIRRSGTQKPIFYNVSHSVHLAEAYFEAGIQGGTFQWYPTGLGYQREIPGNVLPNVNEYHIPFDKTIEAYGGAKLVYEFDAADVGRSYVYPAMARSFRAAGIQIATHFSYDPTFMAYANTEYNTHYMNLAYTPSKALSLMICSEIFHNIQMYADLGKYPENLDFDGFLIDYQKDLALYNVPEKFIYTNHTESKPADESKLKKIAGFGNSPVVQYAGKGAYFMDKIEDGIWRLEVMPDAHWVDNPFGRNSPDKTVGVIKWQIHDIKINLSGLGKDFKLEAINTGNNHKADVEDGSFPIAPGTYILSKKGATKNWSPFQQWGTIKLNDFFAPKTTVTKAWLFHDAPREVSENEPFTIYAQFIAPENVKSLKISGWSDAGSISIDMEPTSAYDYQAKVPAAKLTAGYLRYYLIAELDNGTTISYPAAMEGSPYNWDYYDRTPYLVKIVPKSNPIHLFNAEQDLDVLVRQWRRSFKLMPTSAFGKSEYQMNLNPIFRPDNENLNAKPVYDYSFKHYIFKAISGRKTDLDSKTSLIFEGRSLNDKPCKLQIAFVLEDGSSYGSIIELQPKTGAYKIELSDLNQVKTVTLPRPYPSFLPYYFDYKSDKEFDIKKVESLQFSIGPGIPKAKLEDTNGIGIVSVWLE